MPLVRTRLAKYIPTFVVAVLLMTSALSACSGSRGFSLKRAPALDLEECLELSQKKKHDKAIKCLESYKSRNHGKPGAAEAELAIADAYYARKDFIVAAEAYNLFLESYPSHARADYALYRAGASYLKQAPKSIDRDQSVLLQAHNRLQTLAGWRPDSSYAGEATDTANIVKTRLARQNFYVARHYYKARQYLAAIPRFQTVIMDYPGMGLDADSFYFLVNSYLATGQDDLARKYFELYKKYNPDNMKSIKRMAGLF